MSMVANVVLIKSSNCYTEWVFNNNMLRNSNIEKLEADHLYHFALDTSKHDLPSMFGDVKVRHEVFLLQQTI